MKRKEWIAAFAVTAFAVVFAASGLFAGTTVEDVIKMENPGFAKRTKGTVEFSHKKHSTDYGAKCGDCHHDAQGKPLELKEGDDVQGCGTCHSTFEFDKADKQMKKEEKIKKYYEEAIHANCIGCHKDHNKEKGLKKTDEKAAPETCNKCHPKKKA